MDGAERLRISRSQEGPHTITIAGELDAYSAPAFEAALAETPIDGDLRLEVSEVGFIDSTGIRAVVTVDNELREKGHRVVVVDPSPPMKRLLELTSLDQRFLVEDSGSGSAQ